MKDFVKMSKIIGSMPDYIQGGGGNVSFKHDNKKMSIKASGFAIKDITEDTGYVDVDYEKIAKYHKDNASKLAPEMEQEASRYVSSCIMGKTNLRPSVETGFHSLLKKYVIHTHSVYTNIVCCAENGLIAVSKALSDFNWVSVPYVNPGFILTETIYNEMTKFECNNGFFPNVIFLKNHGLITTADSADECLKLHFEVNNAIVKALGITLKYPSVSISKDSNSSFSCSSEFVMDFIKENGERCFKENSLYPDQLVYLGGAMDDGKLTFSDEKIVFNGNEKEANATIETLVACIYVMKVIKSVGLNCVSLNKAGTDFIKNWESEKYRKSVSALGER